MQYQLTDIPRKLDVNTRWNIAGWNAVVLCYAFIFLPRDISSLTDIFPSRILETRRNRRWVSPVLRLGPNLTSLLSPHAHIRLGRRRSADYARVKHYHATTWMEISRKYYSADIVLTQMKINGDYFICPRTVSSYSRAIHGSFCLNK